jgi:hypothetical protein
MEFLKVRDRSPDFASLNPGYGPVVWGERAIVVT